ncbi:transferase [Streptomyces sp. NPDC005892]|uniref:transferase n=1 Tax=Streptomyces sp. NPDC005892 TaxID=3155593 RepID=UPI0033F529D4
MTEIKVTDGTDPAPGSVNSRTGPGDRAGAGAGAGAGELPRADCTVDGDGRMEVRLALRTAERPRLLMRLRPPKGKPESTTRLLDLEPEGSTDATGRCWQAVLAPEPALAEGRWDLFVLPAPDAERTPLLAGVRDLRALLAGRVPGRTPLPLAVRVPFATPDGTLAVRTWLRTAHAEVDRIEVGADSTTVRARLFGATTGVGTKGGAAAVLRLRGRPGEVRETGVHTDGPDGVRFTFTQEQLVDTPDGGPGVWDVLVRTGTGARPIRVGRLLDDVADRKKVFVHPAVTLNGLTARTYYTLDNELSVEVTAD